MKRTLLALFLTHAGLAGGAYAGAPNPPPPSPAAPLPPLPPLPPMQQQTGAGTTAQLDVKGAITLRADVVAIDVEVVPGAGNRVKAELKSSSGGLRLVPRGDRVEISFESQGGWPHVPGSLEGRLRVELPPGSNVELTTASGEIAVRDVGGDVRLRTASGDVRLRAVRNVEVVTVSGDVIVESANGDVRLRTVSGDAHVAQGGTNHQLEYGTTSGDLEWSGACGAGCRLETRAMSGDIKLHLQPSSSFELRYVTHSGDASDGLGMQTIEKSDNGSLHARYGKGEGLVEAQTFSGDLTVTKK